MGNQYLEWIQSVIDNPANNDAVLVGVCLGLFLALIGNSMQELTYRIEVYCLKRKERKAADLSAGDRLKNG